MFEYLGLIWYDWFPICLIQCNIDRHVVYMWVFYVFLFYFIAIICLYIAIIYMCTELSKI